MLPASDLMMPAGDLEHLERAGSNLVVFDMKLHEIGSSEPMENI